MMGKRGYSVGDEAQEPAKTYARASRRRWGAFVTALALASAAAMVLVIAGETSKSPGGSLAPAMAVALSLLFVGAMILANWLYLRTSDELVWSNNFIAGFWGFMVMSVAYPAWLILWFGRVAPEPDAEALYILTVLSAGAVYMWKRFR